MNVTADINVKSDPMLVDWANFNLPDADIDKANIFELFFRIFGKRKKVAVPEDMPGKDIIPPYILQEFHNVPNGNYSKNLSPGYIAGFDIGMLGFMTIARKKVSSHFTGFDSVLDVGCGGGKMSARLKEAGVKEVWGLDPSPYLLQNAAKNYPDVKFTQGLAENTGFPDERFDGITACFVFHEIPPKFADKALTEFHRVLKPGGTIMISEPSSVQLDVAWWKLLFNTGPHAIYFKWMAMWMHEPFVKLWHKKDTEKWLNDHGFELISNEDSVPIRYIKARKIS